MFLKSFLKKFAEFTRNTSTGVSFLIEFQAEKFPKFKIKHLYWSLVFNKVTSLERQYQHQVADTLDLFIASLITKSKLFAPLTHCVLTHN